MNNVVKKLDGKPLQLAYVKGELSYAFHGVVKDIATSLIIALTPLLLANIYLLVKPSRPEITFEPAPTQQIITTTNNRLPQATLLKGDR